MKHLMIALLLSIFFCACNDDNNTDERDEDSYKIDDADSSPETSDEDDQSKEDIIVADMDEIETDIEHDEEVKSDEEISQDEDKENIDEDSLCDAKTPVTFESIPCEEGFVIFQGVLNGKKICETHKTESLNLSNISALSFSTTFGTSGSLNLAAKTYVSFNEIIEVSGTLQMPEESTFAGMVIKAGNESRFKDPGQGDEIYKVILKSMKNDSNGSILSGELGICAIR